MNIDKTDEISQSRSEDLKKLLMNKRPISNPTFKERIINNFPFPKSVIYIWLLRFIGLQIEKNVNILGRIHFKIRGKAENIVIKKNVILSKGVDLRNREDGKIILHENVYLDSSVRIVAARSGIVEIGEGSEIGAFTIINSGGKTTLGKFIMCAGNVNINSSSHGLSKDKFIKSQPHVHGNVEIGDDVWIGAVASIVMNTKIGEGAIIGTNSFVKGEIPPFAICVGSPAKVIKYRE